MRESTCEYSTERASISLDRGERAVFGDARPRAHLARDLRGGRDPGIFAPVRIEERDYIDGGVGAHADLAARAGCELALITHPMVPVRADLSERGVPTGHGPGRRVRDKGLIWVSRQAWRLRSEQRLRDGLARYAPRTRAAPRSSSNPTRTTRRCSCTRR